MAVSSALRGDSRCFVGCGLRKSRRFDSRTSPYLKCVPRWTPHLSESLRRLVRVFHVADDKCCGGDVLRVSDRLQCARSPKTPSSPLEARADAEDICLAACAAGGEHLPSRSATSLFLGRCLARLSHAPSAYLSHEHWLDSAARTRRVRGPCLLLPARGCRRRVTLREAFPGPHVVPGGGLRRLTTS